MSRYQKIFVLVIILAVASAVICYLKPIVRGLDIAGGIRVVLQADPKNKEDWPATRPERMEKMRAVRKTIWRRVMGISGVSEPQVVIQGDDRVVVELPGVKDPEAALRRIRSTASLEFYWLKDVQNPNNQLAKWRIDSPQDAVSKSYVFTGPRSETIDSVKNSEEVLTQVVDTERNKPILTGKDLLAKAKAGINNNQQVVVNIEFNDDGTEIFRDFTRKHVDEYLAVFFDRKLQTAPKISEAIPNGRAEITGFNSLPEAREMADTLNAGALPIPLKVIAKDTVEPTLGTETVQKVIIAGLVGLGLVVCFMLFYYKLPGAIACIALMLYTLFVIAVFKLLAVTMSLAGIAALIISIGMAVDANILIFERLKEELSGGKTLRAAIDAGFNRAFTAIFDSNMCTAITCAILMGFGQPSVKSFALTLLVGVAISMFTAITVTRTILHLLVGWEWAQDEKKYALGKDWFSGSGLNLDIIGRKKVYFALSAILILPGLGFLATSGLKPGIEFKAGTSVQATFKEPVDLYGLRDVVSGHSKQFEVQLGKKDNQNKIAFIKTVPLSETEENKLRDAINAKFPIETVGPDGTVKFDSVSKVEPAISKELTTNAFMSVVWASIFIVLYLTVRFAIGGLVAGLKFGTCAVIALIHDSAFILGLFAILGKVFAWEVDSLFVTAVLTVIGFSVHDTIVVFDRIRENLRHRLRGESFEQLCNRSILQTFSRSINTSLTVVMTLLALIVLGGPLLRHFYVALLVGIVIGTYSSIFCATPLVVVWDYLGSKTAAPTKKTFEDKPLVAKSQPSALDAATSVSTSDEGVDEEAGEAGTADESPAARAARIKRKTAKKKRF